MAPSFGRHNLKNYLTQWYKKKTKEKKKKKKTREENFKKSKKKIRKLHIINIYIPGIYISIYININLYRSYMQIILATLSTICSQRIPISIINFNQLFFGPSFFVYS